MGIARSGASDRDRHEGGSDPGLELGAELVDDRLDRPVVSIGQSTDGRAGNDAHRACDLKRHVEILGAALSMFDLAEQFEQPLGSLSLIHI